MAQGYHQPSDYPTAPKLIDFAPRASGVEGEIAAIRRAVQVAHDTKKAGQKHGS
ncbi:hypothetical protein [Mameliella sediminis]|uniref:hypothetical protein n=1 Tax=Mameliella sediminis TaxID=2836866 RepID=UPI001C458C5A|nr:hypothetical protein [Mameliella sediminis]MBV7394553.1 hypothetical protein [Mameliella sediminis]